MLPSTKREFDRMLRSDWELLCDPQLEQRLTAKDVIILKLYFALMGKEYYHNTTRTFVSLCKKYFGICRSNIGIISISLPLMIGRAMNPENAFSFVSENVEKVRGLLQTLKSEAAQLADTQNSPLFDLLAVIVNEGLQFAQLVPNPRTAHLEEMARNIRKYERVKKVIERLYGMARDCCGL